MYSNFQPTKIIINRNNMKNFPENHYLKNKFKLVRGYYEYKPKPIDYKHIVKLRNNLRKNKKLYLERSFSRYINRITPPNQRLLNAANKIGSAYKRYLTRAKSTREWQKKKALSKLVSILRAKKVAHRALAIRAAKKYSHNWYTPMREVNLNLQKVNTLPLGFVGTTNQKYNRAITYKKRIVDWMYTHPITFYGDIPLYRGIKGIESKNFLDNDIIKKNNLSSFSQDLNKTASVYAGTKSKVILKYVPRGKIPAIDYDDKLFVSYHSSEFEVLFPPGIFKVIHRNKISNDLTIITVDFTPQYH